MFTVICLETGKADKDYMGRPNVFDSGSEAAEFAQALTAETGKKHQPRRAEEGVDLNWRARESAKFGTGEYKSVPMAWLVAWWWDWTKYYQHYPHASIEKDNMVAYTVSEEDGQRNRQVRVKPGRFLKAVYGDKLDDAQIAQFAAEFDMEYVPAELLFASTPDDIEQVYLNGPDSCMSKPLRCYDGDEHPTRVYGAGDLAIAYIKRGDKISGRALCWPEKKVYGRIYGDETRMTTALAVAGYHADAGDEFNGAKLRKIEYSGTYILPYIDYYGASERSTHLVIDSNGDYDADQTNGLAGDDENTVHCEGCGDRTDEDNASYIDSRGAYWCESCANYHAFYCDDTGEMIAHNDGVELHNGSYMSERAFERHGWTCEGTDRRYDRRVDEDYVVLNDGTVWSQDYFDSNGFQCADCGECFPNEDKHHKHDTHCDSCGDDIADDEDTDDDAPREHVARAGRDESPNQLELAPLEMPALEAGCYAVVTDTGHACGRHLPIGEIVEIVELRTSDNFYAGTNILADIRHSDGAHTRGWFAYRFKRCAAPTINTTRIIPELALEAAE